MNNLYWIFVLGNLKILSEILVGIFVCIFIVCIIYFIGADDDELLDDTTIKMKKLTIATVVILFFSSLFAIFMPSKHELVAMYGVGGVIDYIEENDTAKELPDKCIKAVDIFLDEYTKSPDEKAAENNKMNKIKNKQ